MQTNPTSYINPRRPSCALLLLGQLSLAPVPIPEHSHSELTAVHRLALRAAPRPSPLPDLTTQPPTPTTLRIAATSSSDLHPQLRGKSPSRLLRSSYAPPLRQRQLFSAQEVPGGHNLLSRPSYRPTKSLRQNGSPSFAAKAQNQNSTADPAAPLNSTDCCLVRLILRLSISASSTTAATICSTPTHPRNIPQYGG
jgi:hypothetical protein